MINTSDTSGLAPGSFISNSYAQIDYQEKFRIARVFLYSGAPEQAKLIYDLLFVAAEKHKDVTYWIDLTAVYILLNRQQEAISAAIKMKTLAEEKEDKIKKKALAHYNAVMFHFNKGFDTKDSETSRLVEGIFEYQKKFPEEHILTSIKAIDESGKLTEEIKDILKQREEKYVRIREAFKQNPALTYFLEETFHRSYSDLMTNRDDVEFTIQFTDVNEEFLNELNGNYTAAQGFVFDYLALLDLAKMGFLGFIENLQKPIYVHKLLFQKIQVELLQNEIEELRKLWEFLRKSKAIRFIEGQNQTDLISKNIDNIFDKWIVETIKFAKLNKYSICTDDLRFYRFLKSEHIEPINITVLLQNWLNNNIIDKKMYSRALGDLAERYYTFLSYRSDDLFEIVLEDEGKITPRSYHLIREIFLPGSVLKSFTDVFAGFIDLFWRTGSLPQEKVNWIIFLTNIITKVIDQEYLPFKGVVLKEEEVEKKSTEISQKLNPVILSLAFMWRTATANGNKDDLRELLKAADEVLTKEYFILTKEKIKQNINTRLTE